MYEQEKNKGFMKHVVGYGVAALISFSAMYGCNSNANKVESYKEKTQGLESKINVKENTIMEKNAIIEHISKDYKNIVKQLANYEKQ
ncbi:hypothetical protein KY334_05025 [Candidatus Woesearchaeota archaeon]|nr:hypothetical protein [Candidatus Woesearchaeota archaeon]